MQRTKPLRKQIETKRAAFTLLEVLLVLAILGVIAVMVVPNLLGQQQEAMIRTTRASIKGFEDAVKFHAVNHDGVYPQGATEEVVELLMMNVDEAGEAQKVYLETRPLDAWKNPLQYEYPATGDRITPSEKPAIWSVGPDGQEGTEDDVNNWEDDQRSL